MTRVEDFINDVVAAFCIHHDVVIRTSNDNATASLLLYRNLDCSKTATPIDVTSLVGAGILTNISIGCSESNCKAASLTDTM